MSETQKSPKVDAAWAAETLSRKTVNSDSPWNPEQYSALVGLIKHCDLQLASTHNIHMIAFGAMIPILAVLIKIEVPLVTHVGYMFLGVALAVRWLTQTSKLNLEKLCWVSLARQVEKSCLMQPSGPFTSQDAFFSHLPEQMSSRDKIIMNRIGTRRLYSISIILLTVSIIAGGMGVLLGYIDWPI